MFVSDNFLSSFDRLSPKSTISGRTGTLFGIAGCTGFIIVSFIIFIGPVIFYFNGDYIQGTFVSYSQENLDLYTGCDFKLAVSFYSKQTGKVVNHTSIYSYLDPKLLFIAPDQSQYYADVQACNNDYFSQMDRQHNFGPQDCFIAPNGLGYASQTIDNYYSVFGFQFKPLCPDPFLCNYGQAQSSLLINRMVNFFKDHYYILYFTSIQLNRQGKQIKKFYELYSTEYQGKNVITPTTWALIETQKIYLDDSIMPWYNNQTLLFPQWLGLTSGRIADLANLQAQGTAALLAIIAPQRVTYRQYKKLDWLIGMLGGGILLLFIIFWLPCNFISALKQKYQNNISTTLISHDNLNNITQPKFGVFWYLSQLLPFKLKCFQRENNIIFASERMIDIAELVKKIKVAKNNLLLGKSNIKFQKRTLKFTNDPPKNSFTQEQIKYQLPEQTIKKIRQTPEIKQIYSNNLSMLVLYNKDEENQSIKRQIDNIMDLEKYSKNHTYKFNNQTSKRSCCASICKKIGNFFIKFVKIFDAFGAKPNFIAKSQNFSAFGCLLTLLILAVAILTFALTLKNMGVIRTYWDQIYVHPENQNLQLITGDMLRTTICLPQAAYVNNLVIGPSRVIDIKFYQYQRNGSNQLYTYYNVESLDFDKGKYFDSVGSYYNADTFNLSGCFRPENGNIMKVYGDQHTNTEAYFGFMLTPYCSGTISFCQSQKNITNLKFWDFINAYSISNFFPNAQYYPDLGKIIINPVRAIFNSAPVVLNFTQSIQGAIYANTLELTDNWASWIMGDYPKPSIKSLTLEPINSQSRYKSISSPKPFWKQKIIISGRVTRVVFSSYKIDFLFATIGGCFVFYYFFIGCFGKAYNNYKIKVKLADVLYNQTSTYETGFKYILKLLRIPCCRDQVLHKIQNDLDCTRLAKHTDNLYRLSSIRFQNALQKNLSLIYLKEIIKPNDKIVQQINKSQEDQDEDLDLDYQLKFQKKLQQRKLNSRSKNSTLNDYELQNSQNIKQKQSHLDQNQNIQIQPNTEIEPTIRSQQRCGKFINYFDVFHNNPQLTLDGKRSVKSFFGGFCCIILLIFICVLTSHFLTVYLSDWHHVSLNFQADQTTQKRKMHFETGKNFKMLVSFIKPDSILFHNVSNLAKDVGLSIVKYKIIKNSGQNVQTITQTIDLQPCKSDYADGFTHEYDKNQFLNNITNAYCVPDNKNLQIYGNLHDQTRQYFSLKIYNKYGFNNTFGINKTNQLLSNYIPLYMISNPIVDYRPESPVRYQLYRMLKSPYYTGSTSVTFNTTLIKNRIQFDTAVNPTNQRPSFDSYQIEQQTSAFQNRISDGTDLYYQLNIIGEDRINHFVIKKIKVNQIFGIVGGCIAFLFFGLGCFPRSFNQFKMRYKIGTNIYTIMGTKRKAVKKIKGQKIKPKNQYQSYEELSQCELFGAWLLSYWRFITKKIDKNSLLQRYYLIESRISQDINIYQFMKNLYACQSAINKNTNLRSITDLNLCRVYPKQILSTQYKKLNKDEQNNKQLEELVEVAKRNKFTQWQLKVLLDAKEKDLKADQFFTNQWLDKFLGSQRKMQSHLRKKSQSSMKDSNKYKLKRGIQPIMKLQQYSQDYIGLNSESLVMKQEDGEVNEQKIVDQ